MFEPGVAYQLSPLIRRITAPNPGPMTGAGTNTYLIGRDRIAVIDPGPAIDSHIEAILDAANGRIEWILCTHTTWITRQLPGFGSAQWRGVSGASPPADQFNDQSFQPEVEIDEQFTVDTDEITIESIHTPGHVGNHYCFY
jgi:Zn-dependent hydrolases, including glyoxylases